LGILENINELYISSHEETKVLFKYKELINEKIILEKEKNQTVYEIEHSEGNGKIIELKTYLKTLDLKSSQRKDIKKRFEDALKDDVRIIEQNGKIYIDLSRYDYSDLLAL
jgi:thiamine kinase-like enzyme